VQFGPFILPAPAFVAYRHPCAYKVLAGGFFVVADTIYIGLQIFDAGAFVMFHAMRSYIDQEKLRAAMGIVAPDAVKRTQSAMRPVAPPQSG
jgi:hypothetical protein